MSSSHHPSKGSIDLRLTRKSGAKNPPRYEVRLRPQERRCLLLYLGASLESDERVEPRDQTFDIQEASRAPLAQLPFDLGQVASSDRNLYVQWVECVAVPFHAEIRAALFE